MFQGAGFTRGSQCCASSDLEHRVSVLRIELFPAGPATARCTEDCDELMIG